MFKWLTGFATVSAISLSVFFGVSSASAATIYDDVIEIGEPIIRGIDINEDPCELNIGTTFMSIIESADESSNKTAFLNALDDRLNDGDGWALVEYKVSDTGTNLLLRVQTSQSAAFFTLVGGIEPRLVMDNVITANIAYNGCDVSVNFNQATPSNQWLAMNPATFDTWNGSIGARPVFVANDIDYPQDYEGELIPDTWQPPTPPLTWAPDFQHVQSIDWKIKLQDRNFNTFDPVPFTCNEGLTPVIQYDLLNNDTSELLDQGIFSPTIQYEFQSEKYGIETEYKFIGNYYCGDAEDDPTFSHQTTYYFTLNASGTHVPDTPSCFSDTFPYVDIDGCTAVVENLVNNLSFGTINFPNWSIQSDGCHTLGTIGDWINVPSSSRTICPQFSSTVRNVVTPFLTFVLAITIIGVLVTKSRNDFN